MLWLIGMMGSGKSTVGKLVAETLGVPFVDLDVRIAEAAGSSISVLFAAEGEAGFRTREAGALARVADGPAAVVATGGGVVLDPGNVARMRARGVVAWLEAKASTLASRVENETGRPLLEDELPEPRLAEILEARRGAYSGAAHARIVTDERTPKDIAEEVGRLWPAS